MGQDPTRPMSPLFHLPRFRSGLRPAACALVAVLWAGMLATAAHAGTLRIASAFDPQTMDPHGLALLYHTRVVFQIYDSLLNRDEKFQLEPGLALSWQAVGPTAWRFKLRPGVSFHDGTPFTADDAVFSIERALAPPSQRAFQLKGVTGARALDASTLEVLLAAPDAVLPEKLFALPIMSRAWAVKHNVERAQDFNAKQETFAVRNANGTGPFLLERYEPDVRTVLKRNPRWWGWADKRSGNVDEVVMLPIRSDATRLAALVSGEIDMVLDPPVQDVARLKSESGIGLLQTSALGQQYLSLDQAHDELPDSDAMLAGKRSNPFKDVRVRRAVYQAINVDLIVSKVLRGLAVPTGAFLSPQVDGSPAELDKRLPYDPARSRALLAEAGYPKGFSVVLDCVNVPWREAVCQAMTAMLTQVGIRTTLRSSPTNQFFPETEPGHQRARGIRLDAGARRLVVAERPLPQLGRHRARYLQRRAPQQCPARRHDRRDAHRARPGPAPHDGRRGAAAGRRRIAVDPALPPHADLGDEPERAGRAMAERRTRVALGANSLNLRDPPNPRPCRALPRP